MRINRRRILQLSAAGAATSILPIPALHAQPRADTIRIALSAGGPRKADPNQTTQGADNWATEQMFEQLVRPPDGQFADSNDEFVPTLAESWENSDDAKTWVFKLREGVQFHKGYGEMTAEDVVHSFDRARFDGVSTTVYRNIADVKATGPYEVTFALNGPDPLFLGSTAFSNNASIVSKKADEEKGEDFATDPIGTGPYQMERFDIESGEYLTRFDDYWGEPAQVEKIECVYIADTTARTLALISGELDMIEGVRAPGWIPQMKQRNADLHVDMTDPGSFMTLHINLTKEPFDNLLVRQAIAHALDRNKIAEALAPMGGVSYTLSPPKFPTGFDIDELPEDLRYEYNPDRARELLAEAGHPDGISFAANISQREDYRSTMLIVQELMRPAGINIELNIMDHSAYHGANRNDQNTLALHAASYPPIPMDYLSRYLHTDAEVKSDGSGGGNYSHYGTAMAGVDDLLQEMQQATTYEKHMEIGRQIELQVQRDLPAIGLLTLGYVIVRNPRIDLGYDVSGGYARWRLHKATIVG